MNGYWDVHNHLLPGVDDGASCMEETIEMLRDEYAQGVRMVILTPHYREGMFEIEEAPRREVFLQLKKTYQERLSEEFPGMHFVLGCELHLHPSQTERAGNPIYRMPGSKIVLTEFSGSDDLNSILKKTEEMKAAGFRCIIAHAERYRLSVEDIRSLREQGGIYIQVNAGSILGKEGLRQKRLARKLLSQGLVDLIGSDAHNVSDRVVNIGPCAEWIMKKYGISFTKKLLEENPAALFSEYMEDE